MKKMKVTDFSYQSKQEHKNRLLRNYTIFFSVFFGITLVFNFLLFPVKTKSASMESDIAKNAALFVTPIDFNLKRGDVVLLCRQDNIELNFFQKCINQVCLFFTARHYAPFGHSDTIASHESIRRVLAMPGDTVFLKDYILYVKPEGENTFLTEFELADKPYNIHIFSVPVEWDGLGPDTNMEEVVLGADEFFVLADNRIEAVDSRLYGPVSSSRIMGKVLVEYFPFTKFKFF